MLLRNIFSVCPYLSEVKYRRETWLNDCCPRHKHNGKMAEGRNYKMSDIGCRFVYTLFASAWDLGFDISPPKLRAYPITLLIKLVLSIFGATEHRGRRSFRNLFCSWSSASPFVAPHNQLLETSNPPPSWNPTVWCWGSKHLEGIQIWGLCGQW